MITWAQVMLVQLAAQFFALVALKLFSINLFNVLIIILKFSIIKKSNKYLIEATQLFFKNCISNY